MAKLDITASDLAELLPMLTQFCKVTGSHTSSYIDVVTLNIEGPSVPDVEKVTCIVTKHMDRESAGITARFDPIDGGQ